MDKLNSEQRLPGCPTGYADSNSVVTNRQIRNIKAKSLSYKIEIESDPGSIQTGNAAGRLPRADHTAVGNSVICADNISDVTIDGVIDLSVTLKRSQVGAGTRNGALPSSQGPAVKVITEHKVELIECLRADLFILQHAHAKFLKEPEVLQTYPQLIQITRQWC